MDVVKALVREQERQRIESLLEASGIDEGRLKQFLQEAEDSSDYTEMTAQDWKDIEQEGLALLAQERKDARKSHEKRRSSHGPA